jgi:hypothetical protein
MDSRRASYIPSGTRPSFGFDMVPVAQQGRDSLGASFMDRAGGSSSSMGTDSSYQSSPYAGSPASDDGHNFPQTSSGFRQSSFLSPTSPISPTSPTSPTWSRTASLTQGSNVTLPPFNIERDGDPLISWEMYYDFKVDKNEAYYELQPGYLETPKFPRRKKVDNSKS